jgi:hypothetical protein
LELQIIKNVIDNRVDTMLPDQSGYHIIEKHGRQANIGQDKLAND